VVGERRSEFCVTVTFVSPRAAPSSTLSRSSLTTPFIRAVIRHKTMVYVDFERGWWLESVPKWSGSERGRSEGVFVTVTVRGARRHGVLDCLSLSSLSHRHTGLQSNSNTQDSGRCGLGKELVASTRLEMVQNESQGARREVFVTVVVSLSHLSSEQ
jgi:hypothetical protein